MYLLDTNHCSRIIQGEPSVIERLEQTGDALIYTNVVVVGELMFMVQKSAKKRENLLTVTRFLKNITILPVDSQTAEIYGTMKFQLYDFFGPKQIKKRAQSLIHKLGFSENDLWIAATAKSNNLTIISADNDFRRMSEVLDISIVSWYSPN